MILVTGGLGVMGTSLVQGLLAQGKKVRVLDIPNHPHKDRLQGSGAEIVYGDITDPESLEGLFEGVETVYHLAAILLSNDPERFKRINVEGTRNMVNGAMETGVRHFILVSSISVTYPHTNPYALSKRETEAIVKGQDKMEWTIIRPTLAYNEYGGEEFMLYLDYLKKFPVVPFIGSGKALKNPVHVDDLMKGFLAVADNPKAYGKTYPFCGSEAVSIRELGKLMLVHQGLSRPFLTIPIPVCRLIAAIMKMTMKDPLLKKQTITGITQEATPDWSEAKADLGYEPMGVHEGLEKCFPLESSQG